MVDCSVQAAAVQVSILHLAFRVAGLNDTDKSQSEL
jgi:hypothetical protein